MPDKRHLLLLVEVVDGKPIKEPVHVADLGEGRFRLLYSPGLVQGIAAGDEFRLRDEDGRFEVLSRANNLAVQVFCPVPISEMRTELNARVSQIGGTLDGSIERGLVFTVPLSAGFPAIDALFNRWVEEHPGWEWYYGNVYSTSDGVTPLDWWRSHGGAA